MAALQLIDAASMDCNNAIARELALAAGYGVPETNIVAKAKPRRTINFQTSTTDATPKNHRSSKSDTESPPTSRDTSDTEGNSRKESPPTIHSSIVNRIIAPGPWMAKPEESDKEKEKRRMTNENYFSSTTRDNNSQSELKRRKILEKARFYYA